jgi:hypothetical protein
LLQSKSIWLSVASSPFLDHDAPRFSVLIEGCLNPSVHFWGYRADNGVNGPPDKPQVSYPSEAPPLIPQADFSGIIEGFNKIWQLSIPLELSHSPPAPVPFI